MTEIYKRLSGQKMKHRNIIEVRMTAVIKKPGQLVSSIAIVQKEWGEDAPHWIIKLAEECDKSSQSKVAQKIGRSAALVNQVLKKTYKADLNAIQGRVETVFGCQIACPVLGLIDGDRCLSEQEKPFRLERARRAPYSQSSTETSRSAVSLWAIVASAWVCPDRWATRTDAPSARKHQEFWHMLVQPVIQR